MLDGALARPLVLKSSAEPGPLLRPNEMPVAQAHSSYGLLVKLRGRHRRDGLLIAG